MTAHDVFVERVQWTPKQLEALAMLKRPDLDHIMLYGGARSGKTYLLVTAVVVRALDHAGSRHLIARSRFTHAKPSIWLDTLPKVLSQQCPPVSYHMNETDHYVKFNNGSEIWVDGLDDRDRVDKILGREYVGIYFNEISQIPYDTVTTVLTRLSQKVDGCRNRAYYDLNPAGNLHWAKRLFIDEHPPAYGYMVINPRDNEPNLPERYIEDILAKLPEHKRRRFLDGQWSDPEGTIFRDWEMVDEIPEEVRLHSRHAYGLDFGYSVDPAALVDCYLNGNDLWLDELIYQTGLTNQALCEVMREMVDTDVRIYADEAEPKSIDEIRGAGYYIDGALKGKDSVVFGIDWLLSRRVHVTARSTNIWNEQSNYTRGVQRDGTPTGKPIDDYDHSIDAIRYGCSAWMRPSGQVADWDASLLGL